MPDDTPVLPRLPDDAVAEILLRLPAKTLFRSGAVCKAWRRITTDPNFLARACRQPASIILHTYLDATTTPRLRSETPAAAAEDVALDALPISLEEADRRRLIRYPKTPLNKRAHCRLLASCDGVLLFKMDDEWLYLLCNPITRQWAELPRLPAEYRRDRDPEYAFYFHQPSGEFRLLCCSLMRRGWYILSTGAAGPRHVKANGVPVYLTTRFTPSLFSTTTTPVALHGNVHWPPLWRFSTVGTSQSPGTQMTAFNMVLETFHQMPGPPSTTPTMVNLFEMGGLLVAADFGEENHVDLWFLEDYDAGRWERRHRVASPWGSARSRRGLHSVAAAGDDEGNVILGNNDGLVVYNVRRGETVRTVDSLEQRKSTAFVSRHAFKGSLAHARHACFITRPPAGFPR
ncbi:hypothetical protein U9M48_010842 [Paspalum notatum var. saurae]|uniref:F-box domain-containing protein n=1 Tax=Paspalum notatum var. saurae TaxID=547442 RepID=A0AAQ3WGS5_PASNO